MGLLGNSNSLLPDIEKATSDTNTQEKWGLIMDVCDKVTNGAANSKECLKMVIKRLNHSDPHVVMQAITLLDACVSNCGKQFHLEIASRDFETEFRKLLQKSQPIVNTRLKLCLKKWAESEFKSDPQLNLIPSLYGKLRAEGHDFSDPSVTPKREAPLSKDPNVVSSQQEEEDIAKAIELSLKETKSSTASSSQSPKMHATSGGTATASSSLYPSLLPSSSSPAPVVEPRKVRALYDFEAAEDNELTFHTGEVIMVLDDSDPNWWKGQNQRGEGLFPSNFVTSDLNAEPEGATKTKKNVQFSDEQKKEEEEKIREQVVESVALVVVMEVAVAVVETDGVGISVPTKVVVEEDDEMVLLFERVCSPKPESDVDALFSSLDSESFFVGGHSLLGVLVTSITLVGFSSRGEMATISSLLLSGLLSNAAFFSFSSSYGSASSVPR